MIDTTNRRKIIKFLGGSVGILAGGTLSASAEPNEGTGQPVSGELPNKNVPEAKISPLPPKFTDGGDTRTTGQFLTLISGWVETNGMSELKEFLNSTKQTFTFGDQEFVLNSFDDWDNDGDGSVSFTHTDPPYPQGSTVEVSLDVIVTDAYYDPLRDETYSSGDRYLPSFFPTSRTYEIVSEDKN